ncbi:MAG: DUF559 domain-containing protein [Solirubrobacteraceae bacterium]
MESHKNSHSSQSPDLADRRGAQTPKRTTSSPYLVQVLGQGQRLRVEGTKYCRAGAIATVQRGLVSRGQLLQAGLSHDVIRRLVRRHWLIEVYPGVFAVGYYRAADVPVVRETAAALAVRSPGWLSHQSAAAVWGVTCINEYAEPAHVTVAVDSAPHRAGVQVHRSHSLQAADRRIHDGLPVTSPNRMLLDVAAESTDRELERACDDVLVKRLARASDVRQVLASANGHRGRKRWQSVLDTHTETTLTRSEAEERMLMLIRASGLPEPVVNHRLHGFEVDFHWPRERLVLEVDGFRYHSSRTAFERDRERDAILSPHGLSLMRVTWRQLQDEPLAVIARLAQALATAEASGVELPMTSSGGQLVKWAWRVRATRSSHRRNPGTPTPRRTHVRSYSETPPDGVSELGGASTTAGGPSATATPAPGPRERLGNGPSSFHADPGRPGSRSTIRNPTKVRISPKVRPRRSP